MTKTKGIRITYADWTRLTKLIRPYKGETYAEYMGRVVGRLKE